MQLKFAIMAIITLIAISKSHTINNKLQLIAITNGHYLIAIKLRFFILF